ncbi:response regulator [Massilia sp. H6]|uniref:hybrid sensor histidine kinase/response regulator n=1 Tax=Massilia sp. H6 TaxID=2970464 RepID=UPI0021684A42|nr:response regulator [Massilia sp. H6]UVW29302.1 response regulator [Massilia sp. H6]
MQSPFSFKQFFNISPNAYVLMSRELVIIEVNQAFCTVTGHGRDSIGKYLFDAFPAAPDSGNDSVAALKASLDNVVRHGCTETFSALPYDMRVEAADGAHFVRHVWNVTNTPLLDDDGHTAFILGHVIDVTELELVKNTLRAVESERDALKAARSTGGSTNQHQSVVSEAQRLLASQSMYLHRLFNQAPAAIAVTHGPDHVFELVNNTYLDIVGRCDLVGRTVREVFPEIGVQGYFDLLDNVYTSGEPYIGRHQPVTINKDGAPITLFVDLIYQPIFDANGKVSGIFTLGVDVTAQKMAQDDVLRYQTQLEVLVEERTKSLESANAALNQSQKLEAIGKLTGGVAHDFNNVLQIISGNLQLLRDTYASSRVATDRLELALDAVARGAKLSSQLLAFARRQPLQPTVVNLARIVHDMGSMLVRALGESIEIETIVGGGLWNTLVDRNQLENVVLNLAINARDAMSGAGKLTIELGNSCLDDGYVLSAPEISAGQYVMLAVSDTGSGMPAEIIERAFEPFFTTKPEGQGTGLGLSMAYGFVKQSGGHIKIYSELEHGTTIKIYLPRSFELEEETPSRIKALVVGGTETVLVVEDDLKVQMTVVDMLTQLGYRVLKANDAQSALTVIQSGIEIDLLFTDVVMPGPLRSPELARQARQILPQLRVLFTSGYTQNAIVHGGRLDPGVELLSKPYGRDDLARKVRAVLAGKPAPAAPAPLARPSGPDAEPGAIPVAKKRILLVEDNADLRAITCDMLALLGYDAAAVASSEEALTMLTARAFDIVFTDIHLPGMSGTALASHIRSSYPHCRIVYVSGAGCPPGEHGDTATLTKPYDLMGLKSLLDTL